MNDTVLISGASIAGPSLAYWLHRCGFRPTVVEKAGTVRPGGYSIDLRGVAVEVINRMGLLPLFCRRTWLAAGTREMVLEIDRMPPERLPL